jgi:hypothetical protein
MQRAVRDMVVRNLPPWLAGPWGLRLVGAICDQADTAIDRMLQASQASLVHRSPPADAYNLIGAARNLEAYPDELPASYLARIADAWSAWQRAGGAYSIIGQLAAAGLAGVRIYRASEWTRDESVGWSVFWVFVPQDYAPAAPTVSQSAVWASVVRKWKSSRWICGGIILEHSGPTCGTGLVCGPVSMGAWGTGWGTAWGGAEGGPVCGYGTAGPSAQEVITV